MGCITSTSKLNELRGHENVFRVRVAHLQPTPGTPVIRSGYLELTPRELIFQTPGCEPIVWALQHLRRYGLNGDLFSFEAGRRCMSGPGIYTFRVHNAEELYPMFQRYINAVNTDAFAQVERERVNSAHSVSVMMGGGGGRSEGNQQGNNYLEPAPLMSRQLGSSHSESSSASASMPLPPHDPALDDCPPNLLSPLLMPNSCADQPLRALQECCTDAQSAMDLLATPPSGNRLSMRRRTLDLPPQESAPAPAPVLSPSNNEAIHMYANVDSTLLFDLSNERCYENVSRLELPLPPPREPVSATQEPATPTTSLAGSSGVNYIVLDLDQPKSPAAPAGSPKATFNGFGSGLSLVSASAPSVTAPVTPEACSVLEVPPPPPIQSKSLSSVSAEAGESPANKKVEATGTQGYSTIDFIRTYALNKSSNEMPDLVTHRQHAPHDEELRITRHSKCIRKAYSISE
ncbi:hypothetical protein KR054_003356 [Drosophila jambulina]|nr:hypothetical protein KR054_003356 [Drosophila jambulina]